MRHILLQNATKFITKFVWFFYQKMQQIYYKMKELLQNASVLLQKATVIQNYDIYILHFCHSSICKRALLI